MGAAILCLPFCLNEKVIFRMAEKGGFFSKLNRKNIAGVFAFLITIYHLTAGIVGIRDPYLHRMVHLTSLLALGFLISSQAKKKSLPAMLLDICFSLLAIAVLLYAYINIELINTHWPLATPLTVAQFLLGIALVFLVLESTRRTIGPTLFIIGIIFLLYSRFGHYTPWLFTHKGYEWKLVIDQMFLSLDGILGMPIDASSTYVFMFVVFGSVFQATGAGDFLFDLANSVVGSAKGGPAKVAVVSSALFGTISGSPVANVVTTGSVTIPMMKRLGYEPTFAGAIEAAASTGGAIMPPVMGSAVFLMVMLPAFPISRLLSGQRSRQSFTTSGSRQWSITSHPSGLKGTQQGGYPSPHAHPQERLVLLHPPDLHGLVAPERMAPGQDRHLDDHRFPRRFRRGRLLQA